MDIPEWIQAVASVAALVIGIVALNQGQQIRALSDVTDALVKQLNEMKDQTKELVNHTTIMESRYLIEKATSLETRMPVFEHYDQSLHRFTHIYTLQLKNIGRKAFNCHISHNCENIANIEVPTHPVPTGATLSIKILFKEGVDLSKLAFEMTLQYRNNYNHFASQSIQKIATEMQFAVSAPSEPDIGDSED